MFVSGLVAPLSTRGVSTRRVGCGQQRRVRQLQCTAKDVVQPNEEFGLVVSSEPIAAPDEDDGDDAIEAARPRTFATPNVPPDQGGRTRGERRRTLRSSASWANVFLAPFGRKGAGSRPHLDLRPPTVQTRGTSDVITCPNCKGTGESICYICNGTNFFGTNGEVILCPSCQGKGKRPCVHCYGKGQVAELTGEWWKFGVLNWFRRRASGK
ncbi:hypothetical protein CCYA_CCYA10G2840 [Cyanidiococcus yangmingshanensis]|nr:hypothetical protein CCYA_CCYA10G2840 [Cyanidiococcus yangmingshanensis]